MNASQFPGQTLAPIPANNGYVGDDEFSNIQKINQLLFNIVAGGGGSGGGLGPVTLTGTPAAGNTIVATSPTAAVWEVPIGQAPTWMYDGGDNSDPDSGCFTTNNINSAVFATLKLSDFTIKGSNVGDYTAGFLNSTWLTFTSLSTGKSFSFQVGSSVHNSGFTTITIGGSVADNSGNIIVGELYTLSFWNVYANTIQQVLNQSSITPVANGDYLFGTSTVTIVSGIITNVV